MPKAFTDHEKKLISTRLLDQGYKLFSAYGLKKTNIEEIAKAAGISKGAFYKFYESKEALFLDVIEQVEMSCRQEILAVIDRPGKSPRARLYTILKHAFYLVKTIPLLHFLSGSDFDLLIHRVPSGKFQEHMTSDQLFLEELILRCKASGIPIVVRSEQIANLLYPLVLAILHDVDLGHNNFSANIDMLLELVTAYSLGEVTLLLQ